MANSLSDSNVLDFAVITVANGNLAPKLLNVVSAEDTRLSDARVPLAHTHNITDILYDFSVYQLRSERDQVGGYPSLTDSGKVPGTEILYGTTAATACEGNDIRLSDARTPTGPAGGDLAGTYPSPTVSGLQASPLPTAVAGGFLKRTALNTGWEETSDVSAASDLDDLTARFQILVAQLTDQLGLDPASSLVADMEAGLSLID